MTKATKAVILARVSTDEQEKGYSIDAQLHRLKEYCARKELEVIESFTVVESSTRGERKQFHEMMTFVKRQKQCIAVVADKVDRVQRSFKEFRFWIPWCRKGESSCTLIQKVMSSTKIRFRKIDLCGASAWCWHRAMLTRCETM